VITQAHQTTKQSQHTRQGTHYLQPFCAIHLPPLRREPLPGTLELQAHVYGRTKFLCLVHRGSCCPRHSG